MVHVEPTGLFQKWIGGSVENPPSRWWSMTSMIGSLSAPCTAWESSLWSTRINCRGTVFRKSLLVSDAHQPPLGVQHGEDRIRRRRRPGARGFQRHLGRRSARTPARSAAPRAPRRAPAARSSPCRSRERTSVTPRRRRAPRISRRHDRDPAREDQRAHAFVDGQRLDVVAVADEQHHVGPRGCSPQAFDAASRSSPPRPSGRSPVRRRSCASPGERPRRSKVCTMSCTNGAHDARRVRVRAAAGRAGGRSSIALSRPRQRPSSSTTGSPRRRRCSMERSAWATCRRRARETTSRVITSRTCGVTSLRNIGRLDRRTYRARTGCAR